MLHILFKSSTGSLEKSLDNMLTEANAWLLIIDSRVVGSLAKHSVCPTGTAGVTLVSN